RSPQPSASHRLRRPEPPTPPERRRKRNPLLRHGDAGGVRGEAPQRRAPPPRPHHQPRPRLAALPAGEGDWAITSVLHDATAVAGSGAAALLSAVHGFNTGFPFVQKHVKGPKWLQLVVGVPPLLLFSGASAVFGAYALPRFAQLTVTSYYAASSGSHYAVSQITRQIERAHFSESDEKSR
ncbi:unnamed protein product, partial [Urochloa humidicola]